MLQLTKVQVSPFFSGKPEQPAAQPTISTTTAPTERQYPALVANEKMREVIVSYAH